MKPKLYRKKIEINIESHNFSNIEKIESEVINKPIKLFRRKQEKAKTPVMEYTWLHLRARTE